jgi:hypothetical protein
MIIRIMTEGQYHVPDTSLAAINKLDDSVELAIESGDEAAFHERFDALLAMIRSEGTPLADDDLSTSDCMLPPPDLTLEEAKTEIHADGFIPDIGFSVDGA